MFDPSRRLTALALVLAMGVAPGAKAQAPAPAVPATAAPALAALTPRQLQFLRQALDQAPAQGFPVNAFTPPEMDALLKSTDAAARARGETQLRTAVLQYAIALHRGRLASSEFDDDWGLRPAVFDPAPGFAAALVADTLPQWLDSLPPAYAGYQQLVKVLAGYRAIQERGGWQALPEGKTIGAGDSDARVPALRQRLVAEDPAAPAAPAAAPAPAQPSDNTLDGRTADALKAFQLRHGLKGDGRLDKATLAALNVPVQDRIDQISANMERWRWLPQTLPADRVQVNIAAAVLTLFKDGQPTLSMKAAPGRPKDRTPMLQSQIRAIEFNPPWNVPADIARKELYPKERAHPGYLQREDFHVIRTAGGGERLQQAAGPKSALGQVKFDFANPYGVYMHDTPARAAFERSNRLVSHGCVRLEKPRDLALALLQDQGGWDVQAVSDVIDAGDTHWTTVAKPVAVFMFYWTAFVGPDGAINFIPDPYGWDHALLLKISGQKNSHA